MAKFIKRYSYLKITIVLLLSLKSSNTIASFPERFYVNFGASYSLTQVGLSPVSELRRWYDRGIASPCLGIEYQQPLQNNKLSIGCRFIQKGFRTKLISTWDPKFLSEMYYEYRLNYIEIPITYIITNQKYDVFFGTFFSYLYDDSYRIYDISIITYYPTPPHSIFSSKQQNHTNRYKQYDAGLSVGIARKITPTLYATFITQKGVINIDNWHTKDLGYNVSFLLGLQYKFL